MKSIAKLLIVGTLTLNALFGAAQDIATDSLKTDKPPSYKRLWTKYSRQFLKDPLTPQQIDSVDRAHTGLRPHLFFNRDDRVFAGLNYRWVKASTTPGLLSQKHLAYVRYSINQGAFSLGYEGLFKTGAGKWNLITLANYDFIRWRNFFGLGNNTERVNTTRNFYRMRTREILVSAGLYRLIGEQSRFTLTPFYQYTKVLVDDGRYLASQLPGQIVKASDLNGSSFAGLRAHLFLQRLNNIIVPSKGVQFSAIAAQVKGITQTESFTYYESSFRFYVPAGKHLIFSMENGGAAVTGNPMFYQLPTIGGSRLRGFQRDRFYGETAFYNNTELYYLFNVATNSYKGGLGFMGFADAGRVWKRGEASDTWHRGFGGGLVLVPLQKVFISLQYGRSKENGTINLELRRNL